MTHKASRKKVLSDGLVLLYLVLGAILFTAWIGGSRASFGQLQSTSSTRTLAILIIGSILGSFVAGYIFIRSVLQRSRLALHDLRLIETDVYTPEAVDILARRFDEILLSEEAGDEKNSLTATVVEELTNVARSDPYDPYPLTESDSPGHRLAAIIMLQLKPNLNYLSWLSNRLMTERRVLGLEIANAILSAAKISDKSQKGLISNAIHNALYNKGAVLNPNDPRRVILEKASKEIYSDEY